MGSGLEASCSCGFSVPEFAAGGGMANFTTTCWAPAYCATCRTLVIANYIAKRPRCPTCKGKVVFYDDPSLRAPDAADHGDADAGIVFSWFTEAGEFRLRVGREELVVSVRATASRAADVGWGMIRAREGN